MAKEERASLYRIYMARMQLSVLPIHEPVRELPLMSNSISGSSSLFNAMDEQPQVCNSLHRADSSITALCRKPNVLHGITYKAASFFELIDRRRMHR